MALKSIKDAEIKGKKVIARFDFNVPFEKMPKDAPADSPRKISDTTRIDEALTTIRFILEAGCSKLVLMSHLGRPKGGFEAKYSLEPVATYLAEQLGQEVVLTSSATDPNLKSFLALPDVKVVMLENIRFHPEEEKNDSAFAQTLSSYGDIYVNDAFGAAHRKHASTYGINLFFKNKAYCGFLLEKEVRELSKIANNPKRPFVAFIGGAKVADKIKTLEKLLISVDRLCIGGAMAYPFLKAQGKTVGKSLCSDEDVNLATKILKLDKGGKILLPVDHIIADSLESMGRLCDNVNIPEESLGLDIGPKTQKLYKDSLHKVATIFWNGPMGLFENPQFANGTFAVAHALADSGAYTLVGGGDSVSALKQSGLDSKISHVSTGGGASLEFIENGGELPGVFALKFGLN